MRIARFTAAILVTMAAASLTAACGDDDPSGPSGGVQGTYTLRTIDGDPLPAVAFSDGDFQEEITSGSITLSAGSACTTRIAFRELQGGTVVDSGTEESSCTYTVSGSTLTVDFGDGDVETATIGGDTITFTSEGSVWVFRK